MEIGASRIKGSGCSPPAALFIPPDNGKSIAPMPHFNTHTQTWVRDGTAEIYLHTESRRRRVQSDIIFWSPGASALVLPMFFVFEECLLRRDRNSGGSRAFKHVDLRPGHCDTLRRASAPC